MQELLPKVPKDTLEKLKSTIYLSLEDLLKVNLQFT